jgi:hypothetical protein
VLRQAGIVKVLLAPAVAPVSVRFSFPGASYILGVCAETVFRVSPFGFVSILGVLKRSSSASRKILSRTFGQVSFSALEEQIDRLFGLRCGGGVAVQPCRVEISLKFCSNLTEILPI